MDLQKAIDQISNKTGESVEVTVGAPSVSEASGGATSESGAQPAAGEATPAATEGVGIGSMDSSVSASIDQAISNVGMSAEGTAAETPAGAEAATTTTAAPEVAAPVVEPAGTAEVPAAGAEVATENKDAKVKLAEALLPVIDQADLDDGAKAEVYRVLWDNGNRDAKVISGMIKGADPKTLSEMWKAL